MKTLKHKSPGISHSVSYALSSSPDGSHRASVIVKFSIPSRVAAHLDDQGGEIFIPSAGIGDSKYIAHRVRNWNNRFKDRPPGRDYLQAAVDEGCDTLASVRLHPNEWHLIGYLCGRLRITPGQWFVACAAYNAEVSEACMEKSLMALPD